MKKLNWKQNFVSAIMTYPIEVLAIIYCSILGILQVNHYSNMSSIIWGYSISLMFIHGIHALTYKNRHSKKPNIGILVYTLSAFSLIIPTIVNIEIFTIAETTLSIVLAFLFYLFSHTKHNNTSFAKYCLSTVVNVFLAILFGMILAFTVYGLYSIFNIIFNNILSFDTFYEYVLIISSMFVSPIFWLLLQQKEYTTTFSLNKFSKILYNFILSPALLVYTSIILIYTLKILISWSLPQGIIASIMFGFLCVSFLMHIFSQVIDTNIYKPFFKLLPYFSIIPIILLWISLIQRINTFAFTEMRIYTLYFALLASSIFLILMLFPIIKNRRILSYKTTLLIAFILGIISTFIPKFNAKALAIYSQRNQLTLALSKVNETILQGSYNGTIDSVMENNIIQLDNVFKYLYNDMMDTLYLKKNHTMLHKQLNSSYINEIIETNTYYNSQNTDPDHFFTVNGIKYATERWNKNNDETILRNDDFDYIQLNKLWYRYDNYNKKVYILKLNEYKQLEEISLTIEEAKEYLKIRP